MYTGLRPLRSSARPTRSWDGSRPRRHLESRSTRRRRAADRPDVRVADDRPAASVRGAPHPRAVGRRRDHDRPRDHARRHRRASRSGMSPPSRRPAPTPRARSSGSSAPTSTSRRASRRRTRARRGSARSRTTSRLSVADAVTKIRARTAGAFAKELIALLDKHDLRAALARLDPVFRGCPEAFSLIFAHPLEGRIVLTRYASTSGLMEMNEPDPNTCWIDGSLPEHLKSLIRTGAYAVEGMTNNPCCCTTVV